MKQLSEYKEEIFLRSEKKLAKIKRTRKRIVTSAISLCLCAVVVLVGVTRGRDKIKDNSSGSTSEDNLPIITTIEQDKGSFGFEEVPSIFKEYLGDNLKKQLELNKNTEVIYRVIVEVLHCYEDKLSLWKVIEERIEYVKKLSSCEVVTISEISDSGIQMAWEKERAVVAELTAEDIDVLVKKGGYYIRLAPPERLEGYNKRISDTLTVLLDRAENDELLNVAVVTVIDKYNDYLYTRDFVVNGNYNSELYKPWLTPHEFVNSTHYTPGDGITVNGQYVEGEHVRQQILYSRAIDEYIDELVERLGMTDKRVYVPEDEYHLSFSDFTVYDMYNHRHDLSNEDQALSAGFEIKATKAEIIALSEDDDIKVIYPIDHIVKETAFLSE